MTSSLKKLTAIFESLPDQEQNTLMDFAEFLQSRSPQRESVPMEPVEIPRPEKESVVAAIKRLNQTYPMVQRSLLFNETSELMMQHMLQGRVAIEVIDELEILFEQKYKLVIGEQDQ